MGARALFRPVSGAGVYKAREGACDGVDGKDTGTGRGALLGPFPWPQSSFAETGPGAPCGASKSPVFDASAWFRFKRKQNECKRKQNECKNKNKIKIKNKNKGNCKRQFPLRAWRAVRSHLVLLPFLAAVESEHSAAVVCADGL